MAAAPTAHTTTMQTETAARWHSPMAIGKSNIWDWSVSCVVTPVRVNTTAFWHAMDVPDSLSGAYDGNWFIGKFRPSHLDYTALAALSDIFSRLLLYSLNKLNFYFAHNRAYATHTWIYWLNFIYFNGQTEIVNLFKFTPITMPDGWRVDWIDSKKKKTTQKRLCSPDSSMGWRWIAECILYSLNYIILLRVHELGRPSVGARVYDPIEIQPFLWSEQLFKAIV